VSLPDHPCREKEDLLFREGEGGKEQMGRGVTMLTEEKGVTFIRFLEKTKKTGSTRYGGEISIKRRKKKRYLATGREKKWRRQAA